MNETTDQVFFILSPQKPKAEMVFRIAVAPTIQTPYGLMMPSYRVVVQQWSDRTSVIVSGRSLQSSGQLSHRYRLRGDTKYDDCPEWLREAISSAQHILNNKGDS